MGDVNPKQHSVVAMRLALRAVSDLDQPKAFELKDLGDGVFIVKPNGHGHSTSWGVGVFGRQHGRQFVLDRCPQVCGPISPAKGGGFSGARLRSGSWEERLDGDDVRSDTHPVVLPHEASEGLPVGTVGPGVRAFQALRGAGKLLRDCGVHIHAKDRRETSDRAAVGSMDPKRAAAVAHLDLVGEVWRGDLGSGCVSQRMARWERIRKKGRVH